MKSITLKETKPLLTDIDLVAVMEEGFIQYNKGNCVVPPVGELLFDCSIVNNVFLPSKKYKQYLSSDFK